MIASRLRRRRKQVTLSVYKKTTVSGKHEESAVAGLAGIVATSEPMGDDAEVISEAGVIVVATDVFYFAPIDGTMPAITENHTLVTSAGNRHDVVTRPTRQGGEDNRLKVITRRVNN